MIAQIFILLLIVAGTIGNLRMDFYGREARKPYGIKGVAITFIVFIFLIWVHTEAGSFSKIIEHLGNVLP